MDPKLIPKIIHQFKLPAGKQTVRVRLITPALIYVSKQSAILETNLNHQKIQEGQVILIPKWQDFLIRSQSFDFTCYFTTINIKVEYLPFPNNPSGVYIREDWKPFIPNLFTNILSIDEEALYYDDSIQAFQTLLVNYLLNLEGNLARQIPFSSTIRRVLTYIQSNLDKDLSLKQLAKVANLSQSQLSLKFNHELKTSPIKYVSELRVHQAFFHLRKHPDIELEDLAELFGFSSLNYFSRVFKNQMGATPLQIKKVVTQDYGELVLPGDLFAYYS